MSAARHSTPLVDALHRTLAAGGAALVFALGLFAASPELHSRLHAADAAGVDDGCAVVLFANGVATPLGAIMVTPPAPQWREQPRAVVEDFFLAPPRYLRQPERGPPVG